MSDFSQLRDFGARFLGSSGASIAMLLAQDKVDMDCRDVKSVTVSELKSILPDSVVQVKTAFEHAVTGPFMMFISPHAVGVFANLIMGGDGIQGLPAHLSEIEFHAFSEVMGQVLAASATGASQALKKKLSLAAPNVSEVHLNELALPADYGDEGVLFEYSLIAGDVLNTDFYCFISRAHAVALQSTLSPAQQDENEKEEDVMSSSAAGAAQEPSLADLLGAVEGAGESGVATVVSKQKELAVQPVQFSSFDAGGSGGVTGPGAAAPPNIELVLDVPLQVTVELGRAKKTVKEILDLSTGSIIELDKMDGEPVDVLANGKLFAKGEVVVIGETFGVRVVEIITPQDRLSRV